MKEGESNYKSALPRKALPQPVKWALDREVHIVLPSSTEGSSNLYWRKSVRFVILVLSRETLGWLLTRVSPVSVEGRLISGLQGVRTDVSLPLGRTGPWASTPLAPVGASRALCAVPGRARLSGFSILRPARLLPLIL